VSGARLDFSSHVDEATIGIRVSGRGDPMLARQLLSAVRKCLAEAPHAVVIDLTGLDDPAGECVPALLAAHRAAATVDPTVRLLVCVVAGGLARHTRRVGLSRLMPIFATSGQAHATLRAGAPMPAMRRRHFPAIHPSVASARALVGRACADWQLIHLRHPAGVVISELAANAVDHARRDFTVTLSLRGALLHMAVRDDNSTLPRLLDPAPIDALRPLDDHSRGLLLVAGHATAWGAMPCPGGKVVWATLRARPIGR